MDSDVEVKTILEGLETMIVTHMTSESTNSSQRRNLREEIRRLERVRIEFVGPINVQGQLQSYHTYIIYFLSESWLNRHSILSIQLILV